MSNDDNWTRYGKLVLSELERHEEKQDHLVRDLTDLRLIVAKLSTELTATNKAIHDMTSQMKTVEKMNSDQQSDITLLKYKIGLISSAISTALTLGVQLVTKWIESH